MKTRHYNLEGSLGYIVGLARRALLNRLNQDFEKAGHHVTCEQLGVLVSLRQKDGQNQNELASYTCKDKTSIARLIDGMEKRGLVVRTLDKKDGRCKLIYLTHKGKELQRKLIPMIKGAIEDTQQGVKPGDLKVCKDVLKRVTRNLG